MIVVRNVFQLKFGKAREALPLWKEGIALMEKGGLPAGRTRILTDVVGNFYTLVVEHTVDSMAELEQSARGAMGDEAWRAWYQKIIPLVEKGRREVFQIVE